MNENNRLEKLKEKALSTWNMTSLIKDLGEARKIYQNSQQALTEQELNCLYGLLGNCQPYELGKLLGVEARSVSTSLSRGLYQYIKLLIQNKTGRIVQKLSCTQVQGELENLGYKKDLIEEGKTEKNTKENKNEKTVLTLDIKDDLDSKDIAELIEKLKKIPGNAYLRIERIERGSVVLVLDTTEEGAEWLEQLQEIGELEELLGVPVLEVRREEAIADLGEWLQEARDTFAAGWQTVKSFLNNLEGDPAAYRFSSAVRAGEIEINDFEVIASFIKLLDLEGSLAGQPIPLVVNLGSESNRERDILLQVYPCKGERYVPRGLQMLVLDAGGEIFLEATAGEADDYIQLRCSGQPRERFSVKLVLGNASVSEHLLF